MLTLFTIPKSFNGHTATIQDNAISSWTQLKSSPEVILMGDDPGVAEAAGRFGIRHAPAIAHNEYGTPLVSDAFAKADELASHDILCYVNADIILMDCFVRAVQQIRSRHQLYLMVGQRWNIDLHDRWVFQQPNWDSRLRRHVAREGKPQGPYGIDFFCYPRGMFHGMPPFAVGRAGWDNWLLYRARSRGIPVVDITRVTTVVHQNHGYAHVPHSQDGESWRGPETDRNKSLAGGFKYLFNLDDATWILTEEGVQPAVTLRHLYRRLRVLPLVQTPPLLHGVLWPLWFALTAPHRAIPVIVGRGGAILKNPSDEV